MAKILPNFWLRNSKLNVESTKANVKQYYFTHIAHIRRAKISRNEWQKLYKKKSLAKEFSNASDLNYQLIS